MVEKSSDASLEKKKASWQSKLRVMNERFKSRLDENVFEGVRDEKIYHGLKLTTSTILHKSFADLCFCSKTQEYLLLHKGVELQRYSMQGKQLRPSLALNKSMTFSRMIWCRDCLVCYDPELEDFWILNSSGKNLQIVRNEFRTKSIYYEPSSDEIIVVGPYQSTKYSLDDVEKELDSSNVMSYGDPEFGPNWQLDCTTLIPATSAFSSRLVASYLTALYLIPLEIIVGDVSETEDEESDDFLKKRMNATEAAITCICFLASSSWIITGDLHGSVVAWSLDLECMMTHNNAHDARVTMIIPHPSICGFLTYSCTLKGASKLQVWCCNFRNTIEAFTDLGPLEIAVINKKTATVVALGATLFYLTMRQVYTFFAPLSSAAKWLTASQNPMYPTKVIAASNDNSVRIFSPKGVQLNTQILPEETVDVVSSVFSGSNNELFTIILKSGEILVSDTSACPMKFRYVFVNNGSRITCITVYEYFDEIRDHYRQPKSPRIFYPICIRIIAGTEDGNLLIVNATTGKHDNKFPAHKGAVLQVTSSSTKHRAVSLGVDNCVKVWRIFADLAEPLVMYYALYFTTTITRVSLMGSVLCMVNSSEGSKLHQLLMENIAEQMRLEQASSDDHTAQIINMITSETLDICATSSLDKTIRIWDLENCLIKILDINICAWNLTFSSVKADIVFGAGKHLYNIPFDKYLPPKYRARIVAKNLLENEDEESIPEDSDYKIYDVEVDRNLMLHPVSSVPLASLDVNAISEIPRLDLLIKEQNCALFASKHEDIMKIKNYLLTASKSVENSALMTSDVWEKYVTDLLNRMTRTVPEIPEYNFQNIREMKSTEMKTYNERGIFHMLFGYSIDALGETEDITELMKKAKLPLNGFLPNSILYRFKEDSDSDVQVQYEEPIIENELVKYIYPPEFLEEHRPSTEPRESIRLSQLLTTENPQDDKQNEETALI